MFANPALYLILFCFLLNNTDESVVQQNMRYCLCTSFAFVRERDAKEPESRSDENSVVRFLAHYTITTANNGTRF